MEKRRITGLEKIAKSIIGQTITDCKVNNNKISFHTGNEFFVLSLNKDSTKLSSISDLSNRDLVLLGIISIEDYFKAEDSLFSDNKETSSSVNVQELVTKDTEKEEDGVTLKLITEEAIRGMNEIADSVLTHKRGGK